jgi:putative peptidoglycan lipid II flippase
MPSSANRRVARAAGTVMLALVISQLAGLARSILVARAFGTQVELDAFYAANRVSETLFLLVAGGALGSAFIPTFTGFLTRGDRAGAWRLAASVANLVTLTLSLLAGLTAVFAPQIVRHALAPGLSQDPYLFALAIDLLRIQLASAVVFGLGGLLVGILNSHQVFLVPALTPAMYQLGLIFGVLVLAPWLGIYGLAWGALAGSVLYLLVQLPSLVRLPAEGRAWRPDLGLANPAVGEVARLMGPRLLGVAVVQLNFWVNIWLASQMAEGSVSAVTYGFMLMVMAQAALAQSVATAAMPTLAAQFALGQFDQLRSTLAASLRGVVFLALPASVGLILLREPLVAMLYQRGEFTGRSTEMVAWALLWYAAGLVGHAVLEVLARAFYALHDTRTPVLVGAAAMSLNVVFSFLFAGLFARVGWMPHGGLALANTLATAVEAVVLFVLMHRRLGGFHLSDLGRGLGASSLGTLGLGTGLLVWLGMVPGQNPWIAVLGGVAVGGLIYAGLMGLLGVREWTALLRAVRQRVRKQF